MTTIDQTIRRWVKPTSIPRALECPVCQEVFKRPVRLICGHVFCLDCLNEHLRTYLLCPLCKTPVDQQRLKDDVLVANIIAEFEVYCPYKPNGCEHKGPLSQMREFHIETCEYKDVPEFQRDKRGEDKDKEVRDYTYGTKKDKFIETFEAEVDNCDLMTRLYKKNKELVTRALKSDDKGVYDFGDKKGEDNILDNIVNDFALDEATVKANVDLDEDKNISIGVDSGEFKMMEFPYNEEELSKCDSDHYDFFKPINALDTPYRNQRDELNWEVDRRMNVVGVNKMLKKQKKKKAPIRKRR